MLQKEILEDLKRINTDMEHPLDGNEVFFEAHKAHPISLKSEFNLVDAWWMAEFSRLAYVTDIDKLRAEVEDLGMKVEFFYNSDTEAHLAWDKEKVIVFFRGTEPSKMGDIYTDLDFFKEDAVSVGEVHGGFKEALDDVYMGLQPAYEKVKKGKTIFVTGHSLGGALATLFASRTREGILYTYGSPRVGCRHFAKYMDGDFNTISHYRFVNNADIVPHVPPAFVGFRHCGKLYQLNQDGDFFGNPSIYMKMSSTLKAMGLMHIGGVLAWISKSLLRKSIGSRAADHSMVNYSGSIKKNMEKE